MELIVKLYNLELVKLDIPLLKNQLEYHITKILHMINIINVSKNKLCNAPYITKIVNKQCFKSHKEKLKIVVNVN